MERNVIILNTKSSTPRIQGTTSATTFGQLMAQFNTSVDFSSFRVMEGNSGMIITSANDVFPINIETIDGVTNDLTILISPSKKINSGVTETVRRTVAGITVDITISTVEPSREEAKAPVRVARLVQSEDLNLSTEELKEKYDL